MVWYVIPRNEMRGIKELRVSSMAYSFWSHGPKSGVRLEGTDIEDLSFETQEAAWAAISEAAPQYLP